MYTGFFSRVCITTAANLPVIRLVVASFAEGAKQAYTERTQQACTRGARQACAGYTQQLCAGGARQACARRAQQVRMAENQPQDKCPQDKYPSSVLYNKDGLVDEQPRCIQYPLCARIRDGPVTPRYADITHDMVSTYDETRSYNLA